MFDLAGMRGAWTAIVVVAAAWVAAGASHGDRITFNGETWNDVLIYKSSTMYYVKVPQDGSIFNVPIDAVPPQNVEIVRDPWYRDELKQRFDQNAAAGSRPTTEGVGGSVFNVAEIGGGEGSGEEAAVPTEGGPELEAMEAPATGTGPDPMAAVKTMLNAMQFQVSDQDGNLVATSPDGATTIVFVGGTADGGVEYTSTVPETNVQTQVAALGMLGRMSGQSAPWVPEFLEQEVAPLLQSGGSAEKAEGPLAITAEVTKSGGNVTLHITAMPNTAT